MYVLYLVAAQAICNLSSVFLRHPQPCWLQWCTSKSELRSTVSELILKTNYSELQSLSCRACAPCGHPKIAFRQPLIYGCLFVGLDRPLIVNFKWAHSNISRWWNVHTNMYFSKQLSKSCENEHEWLLPHFRVAVKESESEDNLSWMHWQHTRQLCELWCESDDRAWLRVTLASDRQTAGIMYACFRYAPGMIAIT